MFSDRLNVSVKLTIGQSAHEIPGGNVRLVELDLWSHGFTGALELLLADDKGHGGGNQDELLEDFLKPDLMTVDLSVALVYWSPETSSDIQPIAISGLVTRKSVTETVFRRVQGAPVMLRRYRVELADAARVLWGQHFPTELYTEKSVKDVVDAHVVDPITMSYDWEALTESKRMFFVHLPEAGRASFHDFVLWYVDSRGGAWWYDYAEKAYNIAATKPSDGTAAKAFGDDFAVTRMVVPEVPRWQPVVSNGYAEEPKQQSIDQAQAVQGIRRDVLIRSPIAQDLDDRVALETARTRIPACEAEIELARMPTIDLVPGTLVEITADRRWSSESALVGKTWRVRHLRLHAAAEAAGPDTDLLSDSTTFGIDLRARLEQSDDARVCLPRFRAPRYPGYVEGKILSEKGEDDDITYEVQQNQDTSLDEYRVTVPLWSKQEVHVPFEPVQGSGNVYIPAYKNARVLLAMELEQARLERLLDWRDLAVLSMDVQGEQILFGKSATSNTSIHHVYDDDDAPVLEVARTHDKDTAVIRIEEGTLFIQVKEDSGS